MKKAGRLLIITALVCILAGTLWFFFGRGDPNALWNIISQQCVPNQQHNNNPSPCQKVDLTKRYVLFKDNKGPYHDLVMPTDKITGIEDPVLQTGKAKPYFSYAWNNRKDLSVRIGKPLKDQWISLAINSKYGRSQNQLHIHVSCLRQDVYDTLGKSSQKIDRSWLPLAEKLAGHSYMARKLEGSDLTKEDPFRLLQTYAIEQGDRIGKYGLALVISPRGEMILLANRLKLTELSLGSAEEIQDYHCAIAGNQIK